MYLYKESEFIKTLSDINLRELIEFAESYSLEGNILRHFIANRIMLDENPFSLSLERRCGKGSCENFAIEDIRQIYDIFFSDTASESLTLLKNYSPIGRSLSNEDARKSALIAEFSDSLSKSRDFDEFYQNVKVFYAENGVGSFGINKAFYMKDDGEIVPVSHIKEASFDRIKGYCTQKHKLITNTDAFVSGGAGNNVLLYGDSGTGKSTSIKAVLNMFFDKGLRMIQVQKHQFVHLGALTESLKSRNYRFIVYMDDLSFEDFEVEYKYLKAAIEGGLQEKPENVLIYATSNRRHIIKETFTEREGSDDIHRNESIQEKISLSERFGLMIYYPKPTQSEFLDMALYLAEIDGLDLADDIIIAEAKKWGVANGGLSGRTAEQFIKFMKTEQNQKI